VVVKDGFKLTEEELISFCKNEMAHYKAPKHIAFLESIPKTGSGKLYKKALRDSYDQRA
jgi:fatty-acyl-CoA synthase